MNESLIIPQSQNNGTLWKVDQNYWDIRIEGYFVAHGSHNSLICRFDTNQLYQKILIGLIWYFMGSQNTESKTFYIMKTRLISRAEVLGEKSRGQVKVSFARASLPTDFWKGKRRDILELLKLISNLSFLRENKLWGRRGPLDWWTGCNQLCIFEHDEVAFCWKCWLCLSETTTGS